MWLARELHVKMPERISRIVPRMWLTPRGRARAELSQARIRIPSDPLQGLREIAITLFSFARISAVLGMRRSDFYENGRRYWFRFVKKGGKHH
jgi:integrase/recombinase XerD